MNVLWFDKQDPYTRRLAYSWHPTGEREGEEVGELTVMMRNDYGELWSEPRVVSLNMTRERAREAAASNGCTTEHEEKR